MVGLFFNGKPAGDPGKGLGSGGCGGRARWGHVGAYGGGLCLYCTNQWFAKRKYLQGRLLRRGPGGGLAGYSPPTSRSLAH